MDRSLWDEMNPEVTDLGLAVQWFGVPCLCRCRHCSLRNVGTVTAVPFGRARALADRFVAWKAAQGIADFSIDIIAGYSCVCPELPEVIAFNASNGITSPFLPLKGTRFQAEDELRRHMRHLAKLGVACVSLTFFGLRDRHDRFCGRKGDFEYTMLVARLAAECGLERQESIILAHDAAPDAPELIRLLDEIPNLKGRDIGPWDYRGRGKLLEDERLTIGDIERLPSELRQYLSPACTSEAEWIKRIQAGRVPQKTRRYYLLTVWEDNVDDLESLNCGQIIRGMREKNETFLRAIPSIPDLAALYGHEAGDRFYRLRDLEWKWTDLHLEAHPEIDPAGRFDDLDTVILWH